MGESRIISEYFLPATQPEALGIRGSILVTPLDAMSLAIFRKVRWTLGQLDSWTVGQLDTWTVGQLDTWTSGLVISEMAFNSTKTGTAASTGGWKKRHGAWRRMYNDVKHCTNPRTNGHLGS